MIMTTSKSTRRYNRHYHRMISLAATRPADFLIKSYHKDAATEALLYHRPSEIARFRDATTNESCNFRNWDVARLATSPIRIKEWSTYLKLRAIGVKDMAKVIK